MLEKIFVPNKAKFKINEGTQKVYHQLSVSERRKRATNNLHTHNYLLTIGCLLILCNTFQFTLFTASHPSMFFQSQYEEVDLAGEEPLLALIVAARGELFHPKSLWGAAWSRK